MPIIGTSFGVDLDPISDRLWIVSDADRAWEVNLTFGFTTTVGPLAYRAGDPAFGQDPNGVGIASLISIVEATEPTLYQIDTNLDILAIQNPPDEGTLATVGALGVDVSAVVGFDIQAGGPTPNRGYATLVVEGATELYQIDLSTGAATLIALLEPSLTARGDRASTGLRRAS